MPPNFDPGEGRPQSILPGLLGPGSALPAGYESQPQTQGLIPGQGFAIAGLPNDPNAASHQAAVQANPLAMPAPLAPAAPVNSQAAQQAQNASVLATLNAPVAAAPVAPQAAPAQAAPPMPGKAAPKAPGAPALEGMMQGALDQAVPAGDAVDVAVAEASAAPMIPEPPANLTEAQAEVWRAGQESIRVNQEKVKLAEQQATLDQEASGEKAKVALEQRDEANRLFAQQEQAAREAETLRKEEYKKYQNFQFHDFWKDRGAAREALGAIGILLGSASYDSGHVNQASQLLDKAVTRDFQAQEHELQRREKLATLSAKNEQELADLHAKMRSSLRFKQEAQLNAIAAKLESLSSLGKAQGNILAAKELANTARAHAAQFAVAGQKALEESISKRLEDERTKAQTRHLNAESAKIRDTVGGKVTNPDDPLSGLSPAEKRQARAQFHQSVTKAADIIEKEWRKPFEESQKAASFISKGPDNPESWIGARDFFVRAISGGKVTKAQYDQAASHGAPAFDKLEQLKEAALTGKPSATQRKNLFDAVKAIISVNQEGMQAKRDEFEQNFGADSMATKDNLGKRTYSLHNKRLFADVPRSEKTATSAAPSQARPSEIKTPDGKIHKLQADGSYN